MTDEQQLQEIVPQIPVVPEFEKEDWFKTLAEECKAIMVEHEFTARWTLVEGYHALGKRIAEEKEKGSTYGQNLLESISVHIGKKVSTIQKAMQFYSMFPDLEVAPFGKDVSWYAITTKYLPTPKEKEEAPQKVDKKEVEAIQPEEAPLVPAPILTVQYDTKSALWEVTISPDSFINLDVIGLKKQLDDYIDSLRK